MSARRSDLEASAPLKAYEVANKGGSRLEHVLSVGLSNMSIKKAASMPVTGKNPPFATAEKTPIVNVGISMLHKTLNAVPKADIGVNWASWSSGEEETMVAAWSAKIVQILSVYPNNGYRSKVYQLNTIIDDMGNQNGVAGPGSVNRGYYIYILQLFYSTLSSAQAQGANNMGFVKLWNGNVRVVDKATAELASKALLNATPEQDYRQLFTYFDFVNKSVFNFDTQGDIMANVDLASKTSPKLTKFLRDLVNPPKEVLDLSDILRGMSSDSRGEYVM